MTTNVRGRLGCRSVASGGPSRRILASLIALGATSMALAGCHAGAPMGVELKKETRFESEWRRYLQLPQYKAIAVAGDTKGVYASGVSQGQRDWQEAIIQAIKLCEQRRREVGITQPCSTFAVGVPQTAPGP